MQYLLIVIFLYCYLKDFTRPQKERCSINTFLTIFLFFICDIDVIIWLGGDTHGYKETNAFKRK